MATFDNTKTDAVLITGGGGFLGSHLAESFAKKQIPVVAVDNFCTGSRSNQSYLSQFPNVQLIEADVSKEWTWQNQIKHKGSFSKVFHFASPASPPHYQRLALETMWVNSLGLAHALEFADKHKARAIFSSTSEVYGDPEVHPQPESYRGNVNTVGSRSCYDESKRFGESLLYTHNLKKGTRHGIVRIFNTYGPRMNPSDGRVIINFLVQALKGEALTIYGDGKQTRSFCYVDDLIQGVQLFADHPHENGPLNIGSEKEFTILELAHLVQDLFSNKNLKFSYLPLPGDDPKQRRPALETARSVLKWEPKIPLKEGLQKMLSWLEEDLRAGRI